jgi:hypothetical protein
VGIQVWKTNPIMLERTLTPECGPIYAMCCLDRAGNRLLIHPSTPNLLVVDVPGNEVVQEPSYASVEVSIGGSFDDSIDVTADRMWIAASGRGFVGILDPATLRPVRQFESTPLFSPLNIRQPLGQLKRNEPMPGWEGVSISPDGRLIAACCSGRPGFQLWDAESGEWLAGGDVRMPYTVVFSPDGSRLATSGYTEGKSPVGEVRVWDVARLLDQ